MKSKLKLHLRLVELPLKHPFTTANGTLTVQQNLWVSLQDGDCIGYGESPGSRSWPQMAAASAMKVLEEARLRIESASWSHPEEFWELMKSHVSHHPFAQCALDEAAHDLWGKRIGLPVWKLWGGEGKPLPLTNFTIGLDAVPEMLAKLREYPGWPIYKIKLGAENDLEIMQAIRKETQARLRVDANTGWSVEEAIRRSTELAGLGVEWLEQPLKRDDWQGMRVLRENSALPLIADEACAAEEDIEKCAESFHGINIKLVKAGGLTPARRMIQKARTLGLRVMVGCMCESSIGISAIAQLLPWLDEADLDGALLLENDPAEGVRIEQGQVTLNEKPGTGAKLRF